MSVRMIICLLEWVCVYRVSIIMICHGMCLLCVYHNGYVSIIYFNKDFISTGTELCKVEQQTQVDKKQQQFITHVASILSRRIAFELLDLILVGILITGVTKTKSFDFHVMMCVK